MRVFLEGAARAEITHVDRDGAYALIAAALERVLYPRLGKADKGTVLSFLEKATGLSRAQIESSREAASSDRPHPGPQEKAPGKALHAPLHVRRYPAPRRCRRGLRSTLRTRHQRDPQAQSRDPRRRTLPSARLDLQRPHLQPEKDPLLPRRGRRTFHQTRSTPVRIGQRRKSTPDGRPGHLRVDTVHLGDREGKKGIYVINVVDEVTQFQHLGAVPRESPSTISSPSSMPSSPPSPSPSRPSTPTTDRSTSTTGSPSS